VNQDIPHAGYRGPIDFRVPLLMVLANPLRRLAEHLKIANDGIL
jgi:hypothetical protein